MALDPQLLDILACPDTHHAPLTHDAEAQTLRVRRLIQVQGFVPSWLRYVRAPCVCQCARTR